MRWTSQELDKLKELYDEGIPPKDIEKIIGRSADAIKTKAYNMNITKPTGVREKEQNKLISEHLAINPEDKQKELKVCSTCKKVKETSEFNKDSNVKIGVKASCRECQSKYTLKYRRENREDLLKRKRKYREENREKINKKHNEYYQKNKDKAKEFGRKYYKENKKWIDKRNRKYMKDNPHVIYKARRKRKERENEVISDLTEKEWLDTILFFNNECAYCGNGGKLEKDHLVPLSKGGGFTKSNIIPSCRKCNSSKFNNRFLEWYPNYDFYDKERESKIIDFLNYNKKEVTEQ